MTFLLNFLEMLIQVLTMVILVRVILSWFSSEPTNMLTNMIYQIAELILAPLRRIIPRVGVIDFTPMVAVILLQVVAYLLSQW